MENKVKFNLKNVHIAPIGDDGQYESIFTLPGAVSLSLDAAGDINKFYADGIVYYQTASNNGYEGDLEIAMITDEFRTKILNEIEDTNKVLFEDIASKAKDFAMGFQVDGDKKNTLFWYYRCSVTRPSTEAATTEDSLEPNTDTLSISCVSDENGNVRSKTTVDTPDSVRNTWFDSVYTKATA